MCTKSLISMVAFAALTGRAVSIAPGAPIFGGPTYNSTTNTGFFDPQLPITPGGTAGNGTAVGAAEKYIGANSLGIRAVRWNASGAAAIELGTLGVGFGGVTESIAYAVNANGMAVGVANKYSGGGAPLGERAVRWDASGTATELGNIGTDSGGVTSGAAYAVNVAGTAVGFANKYSGVIYLGSRAVRWDASGTVTELGNLGTNSSGVTRSTAEAVNADGTAVGFANKYSNGSDLGIRAVRWDTSGDAATELGNIGTNSSGVTYNYARAVNATGTATGIAALFSGNTWLGYRAVRWDASVTLATKLGDLGTSSSGFTHTYAYAINAAGTAVGSAYKYSGGTDLGGRAVRWNSSATIATELGNLGTSSSGVTFSEAFAVNAAGIAVGSARKYCGGSSLGNRAVAWGLDGVAIDLNTLLSPEDAAIWTLTNARGISDTGWVTGVGSFDPDGVAGPLPAYERMFLIRVPTPSCPGDLNDDKNVNTADLTSFLSHFGVTVPPGTGADFNGDGAVSTPDLVFFLGRFGQPCP